MARVNTASTQGASGLSSIVMLGTPTPSNFAQARQSLGRTQLPTLLEILDFHSESSHMRKRRGLVLCLLEMDTESLLRYVSAASATSASTEKLMAGSHVEQEVAIWRLAGCPKPMDDEVEDARWAAIMEDLHRRCPKWNMP